MTEIVSENVSKICSCSFLLGAIISLIASVFMKETREYKMDAGE